MEEKTFECGNLSKEKEFFKKDCVIMTRQDDIICDLLNRNWNLRSKLHF